MPELNLNLFDRIVEILIPIMRNEHARRARLLEAFPGKHILDDIDYAGSARNFVRILVHELFEYGEFVAGKLAICQLLETAKQRVGTDKGKEIDRILFVLQEHKKIGERVPLLFSLTFEECLKGGHSPPKISARFIRWCIMEQLIPEVASILREGGFDEQARILLSYSLPRYVRSVLEWISTEVATVFRNFGVKSRLDQASEIILLSDKISPTASSEEMGEFALEICEAVQKFIVDNKVASRNFQALFYWQPHLKSIFASKLQQLLDDESE